MLSRSFHIARHEVKSLGISTEEAILKYSEWMTDREINLIKNMEVKTMKKATRKTVGNGNNARNANITSISYAKGLKVKSMRKAPKVSVCKVFKLGKNGKVYRFEITDERATICGAMKVDTETVRVIHSEECGIERARDAYKALIAKGYKPCNSKEKSEKPSKKQTAKKSKKTDSKKPSKKPSKKSTKVEKKETAKKESKKASKKAPKKETKAKKETAKEFKLAKGNEVYRFETETKTRMLIIGEESTSRGITKCTYAEVVHISDARQMYRILLNKGFKRVA